MSYRLITKATLVIESANNERIERVVEIRAYPSPKRDAVGTLSVNGEDVPYKRTGGKGRGTQDRRYMYFPLGAESAYVEITESEANALPGARVAFTSIVTAPVSAPAAIVVAQLTGSEPTSEPIVAPKASERVLRRVRKGQEVSA